MTDSTGKEVEICGPVDRIAEEDRIVCGGICVGTAAGVLSGLILKLF